MTAPLALELDGVPSGSATFSNDRRYRYTLDRSWERGPVMVLIGLNPSTADGLTNDPTIRRCIGFAKRAGCGGLCVLNLFALRATDPRHLRRALDPVGPENDAAIARVILNTSAPVVAAWGAFNFRPSRASDVLKLIWETDTNRRVFSLGVTKSGFPRHPLYLPRDTALKPFAAPVTVGSTLLDCGVGVKEER